MHRWYISYTMDKLLTRESGIRHFIMLGISAVLAVWTYIAVSLISNWDWLAKIFTDADSGWESFAEIALALALVGGFSILVYWCCRIWMLSFLFKAFLGLFGWLPFVRRLDPEFQETERGMNIRLRKLRRKIRKAEKDDPNLPQWQQEAELLAQSLEREKVNQAIWEQAEKEERRKEEKRQAKEDRREIRRRMWLYPEDDYFMVKGEYEAEKGAESLAGCLLLPFTLVGLLLLRLLKVVGYLVASVGIPVLTPFLVLILASLINMICGDNPVAASIVAAVLLAVAVCVLIVHPILVFARKPRS